MCGIAGIATNGELGDRDAALVEAMLDALSHRGPDDQYTLRDNATILGARRLSIIDLPGGRQPLSDELGTILAAQNGEIYNYIELREELRANHTLRTQGDTETIVHLYEEHGSDFAARLRGMFAIALWDGRERRLLLARDRLGKKPLYWTLSDGQLLFGSELKAILAALPAAPEVDQTALARYLQYQYVPSPLSVFKGIYKLPPASVLTWDGGAPSIRRYWSPEYEPKHTQSFDADVDECLELLREAVQLRLRSDVPVGVFLSGGMDSSVVTALMAELSAEPVKTFSIGFENDQFDELPYARAVAERYATDHSEDVVAVDAMVLLPSLVHHFDEPFADSSALPTYRVSQIASSELKVILTGDGGDESFGGYQRYRRQHDLKRLDMLPDWLLGLGTRGIGAAGATFRAGSNLPHRLHRIEKLQRMPRDHRYVNVMSIIASEHRRGLIGDELADDGDGYLLDVLADGPSDLTDRLLRADLLTYLPEDLLVKVDRATMANSLEARSPLLDQKVVEFAARLAPDRKIKGSDSKVLLRAVAKRLMPSSMIDRPKMGFAVPIDEWFRGATGDLFRDLVLSPDGLSRDYMDVAVARTMLGEHQLGTAQRGRELWSILMFELWARRWLGRSGLPLGGPPSLSATKVGVGGAAGADVGSMAGGAS